MDKVYCYGTIIIFLFLSSIGYAQTLPNETANVLMFLRPNAVNADFLVRRDNGIISVVRWNAAKLGPIPSTQTIIDTLNDLVVINGQTFSQWNTPASQERRIADETLEDTTADSRLLRSMVLALVDLIQSGQLRNGSTLTRRQILDRVKQEITTE